MGNDNLVLDAEERNFYIEWYALIHGYNRNFYANLSDEELKEMYNKLMERNEM